MTGNLSEVPGYTELFDNSKTPPRDEVEHWWEVPGTPETNNRDLNFTGGKMIGGSHAFSYFGYLHPTVGAMQKWADDVGDQSWTYPNTKKYFDQSTFYTPPNATTRFANATPEYDPSLKGNGPLEITWPRWAHPFSTWIAKAFDALGVSHTLGYVTGELLGSSWILDTINSTDGTRATTWTAYIKDKPVQKKIDIFTSTLAGKIVFDGTKATGVDVTRDLPNQETEQFNINAKHEVVLAGGGILSPQLLMVSGVGPADQLEALNIPVVLDHSRIGQNMHDHIVFGVTYKVKVPTSSILLDDATRWHHEGLFKENVTGMLVNPGPDYGAIVDIPSDLRNFTQEVKQDLAALPKDWPELIIVGFPLGHDWPSDGNYATLMGIPMTAKSTGSIALKSGSMVDKPKVIPNWLTSQTDLQVSIASLKYMRRVFENPAMGEILASDEISPGIEAVTWDELEDALKGGFRSMHHPAATLRMGRDGDPDAVTDSRGKVRGLDNVRVVDPSAFPFLPPGLPLAPACMFSSLHF
ncbi:FAD/NAD(P)-binding domain-containing protein [Aspergillus sclerotioniger CBS 115572]|uniref:FAD/NAD(P)-binding domain-containing protein n=1 Tax=Aspergillus sclerotioniger CBS 115572 TaxID=1450535 RepID=A0A317XC05_9EURO|nr:FAD/NAD(P)-binding domain-containing protein [Aspergillus sclerotioniger CBS 115572]PWY96073.1 FAD/NAD(P)-binding domain-containing protein [Aspergillus sclerotioniger CBS 115572]